MGINKNVIFALAPSFNHSSFPAAILPIRVLDRKSVKMTGPLFVEHLAKASSVSREVMHWSSSTLKMILGSWSVVFLYIAVVFSALVLVICCCWFILWKYVLVKIPSLRELVWE